VVWILIDFKIAKQQKAIRHCSVYEYWQPNSKRLCILQSLEPGLHIHDMRRKILNETMVICLMLDFFKLFDFVGFFVGCFRICAKYFPEIYFVQHEILFQKVCYSKCS
jgi:hypothetical protein